MTVSITYKEICRLKSLRYLRCLRTEAGTIKYSEKLRGGILKLRFIFLFIFNLFPSRNWNAAPSFNVVIELCLGPRAVADRPWNRTGGRQDVYLTIRNLSGVGKKLGAIQPSIILCFFFVFITTFYFFFFWSQLEAAFLSWFLLLNKSTFSLLETLSYIIENCWQWTILKRNIMSFLSSLKKFIKFHSPIILKCQMYYFCYSLRLYDFRLASQVLFLSDFDKKKNIIIKFKFLYNLRK